MKIEQGSFWVMKDDPEVRAEVLGIHSVADKDWVAYQRNFGFDVVGRLHTAHLFLGMFEPAPKPFFEIGKTYEHKNGSSIFTIEELYHYDKPSSPDYDVEALALRTSSIGLHDRVILSRSDFRVMTEIR